MIDIYEALKSGQTPDAIAQIFVDELNAAIAKQEADKKAAEESARAQAQQEKDKKAVVDCINAYLAVYYPDMEPIDEEFVDTTINANQIANKVLVDIKENKKPIDEVMDDVFSNFFKEWGI